jgi:signal peptidase I
MLIFKNRFSKRNVLLINFIFTLIDIVTVIDLYQFNTALLVFTFIGEVVLTSIYNNSLESLISYNNGPIPPIIFRLIMELYVYFVPIIPNLGIYLNTVITVCLPVLLILCLNKLCYNYKNVSKKKVSISKMYITIPLVIIFISVCSLVSGIFKYKIVAVASNSMIPVFERGDAVIYEKVNSVSNLNVGDILVFEQNDVIYIHRIVEIVYKNKEYNIYTKGDNNAYQDDFITTSKDVVGVVRQEVKYIGYPTIWVTELFER